MGQMKSNKFENDGWSKYGQARFLQELTRQQGMDPDLGIGITPDGDFPFDPSEAAPPPEVPWQNTEIRPQPPRTDGADPMPGGRG